MQRPNSGEEKQFTSINHVMLNCVYPSAIDYHTENQCIMNKCFTCGLVKEQFLP